MLILFSLRVQYPCHFQKNDFHVNSSRFPIAQYNQRMKIQGDVKDNILFQAQSLMTNGYLATKTVKASDIVLNKFGGSLSAEMKAIPILSIEIRDKQLDKPLPKIKEFFATMFAIKTKHSFLLFESQNQYITVDYYEGSHLVIRIGDLDMVLQKNESKKRIQSQVMKEKSGLQWKREYKMGMYSFGELLDYLLNLKLRPFAKLAYNGTNFSRDTFNYINNSLSKYAHKSNIH